VSRRRERELIMASACLFIGWDRPRAGKEREAYGQLPETLAQVEKFRQAGWFEDSEVVGLTPHSGTLNNFILLKGDRAKLDELRRTDAFEHFSMRLMMTFEGYGVFPGVTLEGLQKALQRTADVFK
jgi:hypothetical protein